MGHPYRVREIAQQAGLSEATVDRVLHGRPGVRASTAAEVRQAISDLDRQRDQVRLAGKSFLVDLVMQAPQRFSSAVRAALEAGLPLLRPALVRARFHLREEGDPEAISGVLARLRGSHGVLLKAPDHLAVVESVNRLADAGVPAVTLVTDLPRSRRIGYVGIDNRAAGATAAYLITKTGSRGPVLIALSRTSFRGEEEREAGFRATLAQLAPERGIVEVTDTDGLDVSTRRAVSSVLEAQPDVDAIYSIGGGNVAILDAFRASGRSPETFIAHDLDGDNRTLLRRRQLTAVLHHDLRADAVIACRMIMAAHGALPPPRWAGGSPIHVVTPYNEPG